MTTVSKSNSKPHETHHSVVVCSTITMVHGDGEHTSEHTSLDVVTKTIYNAGLHNDVHSFYSGLNHKLSP